MDLVGFMYFVLAIEHWLHVEEMGPSGSFGVKETLSIARGAVNFF